jgi:hypothetical protein
MFPIEAVVGDEVAVLRGGKVPFVLRPEKDDRRSEENMRSFVGGAYVNGFMNGEARKGVEEKELKEQTFALA